MPIDSVLEISKELAPMLLPFFPYLLKGVKLSGQEFIKKIGEKGGEKVWEVIDAIWKKIKPKIEDNETIKSNAEALANNVYTDENAPNTLQSLLTDILTVDIQLTAELSKIIKDSKSDGISINNYIETGHVVGELIGVEIGQLKKLNTNINSYLKINEVKKGGKVTGLKIDILGE